MPGSVDSPVRFGNPFQRIVEVGWSSKHIAAQLDIGLDKEVAGEASTADGPGFEDPWTTAYLASLTPFYADGAMKTPHIFSGGLWHSIPTEETVFFGEPSVPGPYSYTPWEHAGNSSSPGSAAAGIKAPFHRYEASGEGSTLDAFVPGSPSQKFTSGLTAELKIRANDFASGPFDSPLGPPAFKWAKGVVYLTPDTMPVIETETLSGAGLSLTYRDKTYSAVGSKCVPGTGLLRGEFWVLFEKVPA